MNTKIAVSAGGVVFRKKNKEVQVIAAIRAEGKVWCLPKGVVEQGESIEEAALREVREETGLVGKIIDKIDKIEYWFYWKPDDTKYHKFVHFFLMAFVDGDTSKHDSELDEVKWLPIDKAIEKLSYKGERHIMEKAKQIIENMDIGGQKGLKS